MDNVLAQSYHDSFTEALSKSSSRSKKCSRSQLEEGDQTGIQADLSDS